MNNPILIRFLGAAILLGLAIFVHEAGHFIAAKRRGVRVEIFSLGFGPKIFSFCRGDTKYQLSLIPLGGYIKMAGENPGEGKGAPDEFFSKTPFERISIVAAGPFMNLILAYIVIAVMFAIGVKLPEYSSKIIPAEVGETIIGAPAYLAGITPGDKIISINGKKVLEWQEMAVIIHKNAGKEISLMVKRKDKIFQVSVTPISQGINADNTGIIGISPPASGYYIERFGWKSIPYAFYAVVKQIGMTYKILWGLITNPGEFRKLVGGPIMVVQMAGEEARKGLSGFLGFMGSINIMLAIINLIPFPVLDGGHIMFFLIEKFRHKALSIKTQEFTQKVGLSFLIALMVFLMANDTLKQVNRAKALRKTNTGTGQKVP